MKNGAVTPWILLPCILLVTAIAYWPGLHGPFVFDDEANFAVLKPWLEGQTDWQHVVFGVGSGPGGRPLSIASFVLNAWMGGLTPFAFKAGNLVLHLLNGVLLYALASRLVRRDPVYAPYASFAALALTAVWLLHPLLVGTVLYSVQRMAMLSATFVLAGMLCYCNARAAFDAQRQRVAWAWLFIGVPVATLLAAAAKENGLLLPAFCGVLELCYFRPQSGRRPAALRAFFALSIALPAVAGIGLFAFKPALLLGGYASRSFTLWERLLTEARILWDYVGNILLPYGPRMSLYRDDYVISTSLVSPSSTLLAVMGWVAAIVIAWRLRAKIPAVPAGLGIFLVGHAMESTVIPLLLYFEHRNYLPAFGILWAAGGLLLWGATKLAPHMSRPRLVFGAAVLLVLAGLALAAHNRAWIWASKDTLLAASAKASPGSRWVRMDMGLTALQKDPIDTAAARAAYAALQAQPDPISRQIGAQGQVAVDCGVDNRVDASKLDPMFARTGAMIEPDQLRMIEMLGGALLRVPCDGLSKEDFASRLGNWLDKSPTPEAVRVKQNLRFLDAQLWLASGQPKQALQQATLSWNSGAREFPFAALIIETRLMLGQRQEAQQLLDETMQRIPASDRRANEVFNDLQRRMTDAAQ